MTAGGRLLAAALALAPLTACAAAHDDAAARVAQQFVRAVTAHDGAQACRLLTPAAASSAAGATKATCARAVVHLDESGTAVRRVEVWRDAAQVRLGSDTVFLRRLAAGWRVSAAGCTFRGPDLPYECDVEG